MNTSKICNDVWKYCIYPFLSIEDLNKMKKVSKYHNKIANEYLNKKEYIILNQYYNDKDDILFESDYTYTTDE